MVRLKENNLLPLYPRNSRYLKSEEIFAVRNQVKQQLAENRTPATIQELHPLRWNKESLHMLPSTVGLSCCVLATGTGLIPLCRSLDTLLQWEYFGKEAFTTWSIPKAREWTPQHVVRMGKDTWFGISLPTPHRTAGIGQIFKSLYRVDKSSGGNGRI